MAALPGHLDTPHDGGRLHLFEAGPLATAEEALADVAHWSLDTGLVFRFHRPRRVNETAVVLGQLHVAAVEFRVIQVRLDRAGLQVVWHQPGWDPAEELERGDMRVDPRRLVHREHRPDEHVPTHREDHHEHVQLPAAARHRISPQRKISVVDLGFTARLDLRAQHGHVIGSDLVTELDPHITTETGHAHREPALVAQTLPHRGCLVRLEHLLDPVAVRVDHPERQAPRFRIDQLREPAPRQLKPFRPTQRRPTRHYPGRLRRGDVLADSPAVHPDTRRHLRLRPTRMPVLQNLYDVDHLEHSPCHKSLPARRLTSQVLRGQGTKPRDTPTFATTPHRCIT